MGPFMSIFVFSAPIIHDVKIKIIKVTKKPINPKATAFSEKSVCSFLRP